MAKQGVLLPLADMFGPAGQRFLDDVAFDPACRLRVESLRELIGALDKEVTLFERDVHKLLRDDKGYRAVQAIEGVGKTMAAIFVAEVGDITRFSSPEKLACWAGLTPRHDESDTKVRRYGISKQGSSLVRWAAIEAVARYHGGAPIKPSYQRIAARRATRLPGGWRRLGSSSTSSTPGSGTARSVARPRRGEKARARPAREP